MKKFVILTTINLLAIVLLGPIGILTSVLTIFLVRRGAMVAKAYIYLDELSRGSDVSTANGKVRNMTSDQLASVMEMAKSCAKMSCNGSQLAFINMALSAGMEGGGWIDRLWVKSKAIEKDKTKQIITESKDLLNEYKHKFITFRNVTYTEFARHRDASDMVMNDDDRILFMRYLVEANEVAMEQFGVHNSLRNDLNVLILSELGIPDEFARGMLDGFKMPPLRDPMTNEIIDDYRGAGAIAYKDWVIGGDGIAMAKAEMLWERCVKMHKMNEQFAVLGF